MNDFKLSTYHQLSERVETSYKSRCMEININHAHLEMVMNKTFYILTAILLKPIATQNQHLQEVLHLLLCRSMKSFYSIKTLLFQGMEQDAIALQRNLVETVMTLKYIASDPSGGLAERFKLYKWIEHNKNLNKHQRIDPSWKPRGGDAEIEHIKKNTEEFKNKYSNKKPKSWHGFKGLDELAKNPNVNMVNDYIECFSTYSLLTHPSYISLKEYQSETQGNVDLTWGPSSRHVKGTPLISIGFILKAVKAYIACLGVSSDEITNALNEISINLHAYGLDFGVPPEYLNMGVTVERGKWGILPEWLIVKSS